MSDIVANSLPIMDEQTTNSLMNAYLQEQNVNNYNYGNIHQSIKGFIDGFINKYNKQFVVNRKLVVIALFTYLSNRWTSSSNGMCWYSICSIIDEVLRVNEQPEKENKIDELQTEINELKQQVISLTNVQKVNNECVKHKEKLIKFDFTKTLASLNNLFVNIKEWFNKFDSFTSKYIIISFLLFMIIVLLSLSNGIFTIFISLLLMLSVLSIITQFKVIECDELNNVVETLKDKIEEY